MNIKKAVLILSVSVIFIAAAVFSVSQISGKKPQEHTPDGNISTETGVTVPTPEPTAESTPTPEPTATPNNEKTHLGDLNIGDISALDSTAVTWGPGNSFNDKNQPTANVALQEKYGDLGAVFLNDDDKIYLTFDLGYEAGYTNDILDVLKETDTKAVFFLTGSYAEKQEEIVRRIIDEGHTVGNHSYSHPDMPTLSDSEAALEITKVGDILKDKYGYDSYLFRFPAGTFSQRTVAIAAQNGYHSVFWSFAYNDWDNANQPDKTQALQKLTDRLHPGAVYLLHPMETNSLILKDFITNARNAGYEIGAM